MDIGKKALLLSYISTASISGAILTPALPTIEAAFNLSIGSVEWVVTIFLIGYMLGQLIYGPLANRYGRLQAIRTGFLINILGILFAFLAIYIESFLGLVLARFITSFGAAAGLCCTFTLIYELLPEAEAKTTLAYSVLSFTFGIGLSIFIGGLITEYLHWKVIFLILLMHGVGLLASTWQFTETHREKIPLHPKEIAVRYLHVFRDKKLVVYATIFGVTSVFSYCYSTAAPMIAKQVFNLNPAQYGSWNTSIMIGMLLGSITGAQIMKKKKVNSVVSISLVLVGLGYLSFFIQRVLFSPSPIWFFTTASLLYLFIGWLYPSASFLALKHTHDRASASSVMNFINMGASVISVAAMGYLPLSAFSAFLIILYGYLILVFLGRIFFLVLDHSAHP